MRILVICRPRPGVTRDDIAPHAAAELAELARLRAEGLLAEAWSPGGPGAVLIFEAEREAVTAAVAALPLRAAGLIGAEIIELHPFPFGD